MRRIKVLLMCCLVLFSCSSSSQPSDGDNNNEPQKEKRYFTNPVRPTGADPWVIQDNGKYYFSESNGNNLIYIHEFTKISEMSDTDPKLVYDSSTASIKMNALWGPHINKVNGEWYIYFCAQIDNDPAFNSQRMWVLKSSTNSPYGPYELKGEVLNSDNTEWAIDGSVLQKSNGELYFVWSGISKEDIENGSLHQKSYIAKMIDPTKIDRSTITLISEPSEPWETSVRPIQEGQRPLYVDKEGKTIVMFSANASWTDEYCLGSLTNTDGNFLNPSSWTKSKNPLFKKTENVFGPGGASYVKSRDGKEDWIIYHAAQSKGSGWNRNIRAQKFIFDENNNPLFGEPVEPGKKIEVPSGE